MKINKTYLIIVITSVSLLAIFLIQINWILETANVREELFNERASMILSKTAEALSSDKLAFRNLQINVGKNDVREIDSIFRYYMKYYNIHVDYYFEVKSTDQPVSNVTSYFNEGTKNKQESYQACIGDGDSTNKNLELKLVFPKKEQFIRAEMGTMFITSIILIVVVLFLSWKSILSLMKEKLIADHTTDFLNNMTHEFKTPLTNISLAAKMLFKESIQHQEQKMKHYSEIILEENERLKLQVEQVLSMTALERGEIPLDKTEINLHELINLCIKRFRIQVEIKGAQITSTFNANNFWVTGDKIHLNNVFCNLIDNAIKYSPDNPEIEIHSSNSNGNLTIAISDKGIGIEKRHQKKVFKKFFRVPTGDIHDVKGFGLGLTYIKNIIELHSGNITVQSNKGKGSTFTIVMPYVERES